DRRRQPRPRRRLRLARSDRQRAPRRVRAPARRPDRRPRDHSGHPQDHVGLVANDLGRSPQALLTSRPRENAASVDVPPQFFQSVIAIELAVTGALLWQMRFFESRRGKARDDEPLPDARLRLALALVLGTTLFGSLWAIADEGPKWAALVVTVGLAVS